MENKIYRDPVAEGRSFERRSGIDRRNSGSFWELLCRQPRRRRSRGRRQTDKGAYVDIYDFRTWGIAIAVLLLSLLDAFLTRMHLLRGSAQELNPLMKAIIDMGGYPVFFTAKIAMTIFPMAIIVIHKEWTFGRYAARLCLWAYLLLTCYHFYLLLVTR
jgi:heme exporter protein D